ncbi:MAG TPA: hypothetical protein VFH85_06875 [Gammaproteobacteria bacterium]|nr:hypothetical protein [Gammaproteobacteria bacterium]
MKIALSLLSLLPLAFAASLANAAQYYPADALSKVIQGPQRSVANKLRDKYRHPHATLEFFGLKPDMTVVELEPGGGWYTEILAPYLKDHGHLIEAAPPTDSKSQFMRKMAQNYRKKLEDNRSAYGDVKVVPFAAPEQMDLGEPNSADMVLTFRNAHDWKAEGTLKAIFQAAYKVLKPGGVFGVVAHRANPDTDPAVTAKKLHRLPEAYVINLAQEVGFKLDAVSRINANPADPRVMNIHMLPPSRAAARGFAPAVDHVIDSSKAKHGKEMKAFIDGIQPVFDHIGESDRMTLRFVKPKNAGG